MKIGSSAASQKTKKSTRSRAIRAPETALSVASSRMTWSRIRGASGFTASRARAVTRQFSTSKLAVTPSAPRLKVSPAPGAHGALRASG